MPEFIRRDLTALSRRRQLSPVVGRDGLIREISSLIVQPGKSSVILTGEPGVGKTSIVEGVAQWLTNSNEASPWQILELDCNALVAGTVYRGQFEERAQKLLIELGRDEHLLGFIDEVHAVLGLGTSSDNASPFANMLKPYLSSGQIRLIAATTNSEYELFSRKDPALARRFLRIDVPEPSEKETVAIVRQVGSNRGAEVGVVLDDGCAEAIVEISARVNTEQRFPDKALDLLLHCIADKRGETAASNGTGQYEGVATRLLDLADRQAAALEQEKWNIGLELSMKWTAERQSASSSLVRIADVRRVASKRFGTLDMGDQESINRVLTLRDRINNRIIGQGRAIEAVCDALKRVMALGHTHRPIGSFLFLGPTGVGKTELARIVAQELWGTECLLQFNMSEFMDREAVSKLIGSPPGYIGYEEGGRLVRAVRNKPRSVVLFDEFEKANPDVHNLLLQILEEGQLQDGTGKTCSFCDCLVILTTNAAAERTCELLPHDLTWDPEMIEREMLHHLQAYFRPEILNRLDRVVVFRPLDEDDLSKILVLLIEEENRRLRKQHMGTFAISEAARKWIVARSYDPDFGARPLRRVLQDQVLNLVADCLLERRMKGLSITETPLIICVANDSLVVGVE